jgi:hypothetical protein
VTVGVRVGVVVSVGVSVGVELGVEVMYTGLIVGGAVGELIICPHPTNKNASTSPMDKFLIILPSAYESNGNHTAIGNICQLLD